MRGDLQAVFVGKIRIHGGRLAAAGDGSMPVLLRDDDVRGTFGWRVRFGAFGLRLATGLL